MRLVTAAFLCSAAMVSVVVGQGLACSAGDYLPVVAPCNASSSSRSKTYRKKPQSECAGPATVDLHETMPCTCAFDELVPQYSTQSCPAEGFGYQTLAGYTGSANCSVASDVHLEAVVPSGPIRCACTAADVAVVVSDCVGGLQRRIPYWRRDCRVDPNVFALPPATWFSCALQCQRGQFLGERGVCEACPPGSYGLSSKEWLPPYSSVPPEAFTACIVYGNGGNNTCTQTWMASDDGAFLTSGPTLDKVATDIELMFLIEVSQSPATLSFDYSVSSEPYYDYLVVYVNENMVILESGEVPWKSFTMTLPASSPNAFCAWQIESLCLWPSQLAPYQVGSFFDASQFSRPTAVTITPMTASCTAFGRPLVTGVTIFMSLPPNGLQGCTYADIVKAVLFVGAPGVIFITDDVITGSSAALPVGSMFIVGSVSRADGAILLAKLATSSSLKVTYTSTTTIKHRVTFVYSKDPFGSAGEDRAKIRKLVVDGAAGALQCKPCAVGTSSRAGATSCSPCDLNTYSNVMGQATPCPACAAGTGAPRGSTVCAALPACGIADFLPLRTPCVVKDGKFVQNLTTIPVLPSRCNLDAAGYVPQPLREVPCDMCPAGMFRSNTSGHCEQCASNEIVIVDPKTDTHTCNACQVGYYPSKSLVFSSFNRLHNIVPDYMVLECTACLGAGWAITDSSKNGGVPSQPDSSSGGEPVVLGVDVWSVGPGVMPGAVATMTWNITTMVTTSIDFTYSLLATPSNSRSQLVFSILGLRDGRNITIFETTVYDSTTATNVRPFVLERFTAVPTMEPGQKYFRWIYYNNAALGTPTSVNAIFAISSVSIPSASTGAATVCTMCQPGYECPVHVATPLPCFPGSYADGYATTECHLCPPNAVTSTSASVTCTPCGRGMITDPFNRHCLMPICQLQSGNDIPPSNLLTSVRRASTPLGIDPIQVMMLNAFGPTTSIQVTGLEQRLQTVSVDFRLCNPTLTCNPGDERQAFACGKTSNGDSFFLGDFLAPYPIRRGNTTIGVTFHITGANCHTDPSKQSLTIVNLVCDPTVDHHQVESARSPTPCIYNLTLRTSHACSKCTNMSFVKSVTSCTEQDGTSKSARDIYYNYAYSDGTIADSATCVGGEPLPHREMEECPWISFTLSQHWDSTWSAAMLIIVIAVLLVGCAAYFWISHRKLYAQYTKLQGGIRFDNGVEMSEVPDATDAHDEPANAMTAAPQPVAVVMPQASAAEVNDSDDFDDNDDDGLRKENVAHPGISAAQAAAADPAAATLPPR